MLSVLSSEQFFENICFVSDGGYCVYYASIFSTSHADLNVVFHSGIPSLTVAGAYSVP